MGTALAGLHYPNLESFMTSHELARQLLEMPDCPIWMHEGRFREPVAMLDRVPIPGKEAELEKAMEDWERGLIDRITFRQIKASCLCEGVSL